MLYFLGLRLLKYITFRTAYATIFSFLLSLFFGPKIISFLKKFKFEQQIREDGPKRHIEEKNQVPTMGGLLIFLTLFISLMLWGNYTNFYFLILLFTTFSFAFIGFLDDYLKIKYKNSGGLNAKFKIYGQFLFSLITVSAFYYLGKYYYSNQDLSILTFPFLKAYSFDLGIFYIPFGVLILMAFSNAFNLTDGLDGLAIGLGIIVIMAFIVIGYLTSRLDYANYLNISYVKGVEEIVVYLGALLGACLGFLWFNAYPAKVMMGDVGSLSLGAILGYVALILKSEFLLLILAFVFVIETLSVIFQVAYFKRTGKRIFKMAPIHHHFEEIGWSENQIVMRFWIIGFIFAIIALSTLKIR